MKYLFSRIHDGSLYEMYDIFTNIWRIFMLKKIVGKYSGTYGRTKMGTVIIQRFLVVNSKGGPPWEFVGPLETENLILQNLPGKPSALFLRQ